MEAAAHFDNPNDGPPFEGPPEAGAQPRYTDSYLFDALMALDSRRTQYGQPLVGGNFTSLARAFGRNTHALADFYAHSNWVDAATRGGCYRYRVLQPDPSGDGPPLEEWRQGWVPHGQARVTIWGEDLHEATLFSGTTRGSPLGDITDTQARHTHGYWNKDEPDSFGGALALDLPQERWTFQMRDAFGPGGALISCQDHTFAADEKCGKEGYVMVKVTTAHLLARQLAIEHTLKEIERLYSQASQVSVGSYTLAEIFAMDQSQKDAAGIYYGAASADPSP